MKTLEGKILYIDIDDTCADYTGAKASALREFPEQAYPQAQHGFFRNLLPIFGAVAAIKQLSYKYDVYFLTAPSYQNPLSYTEKMLWVKGHFGEEMVKKLIISKHKHLNMGHYLIDDRPDYNGAGEFTGELIHFGTNYKTGELNPFPTWESILKYLL